MNHVNSGWLSLLVA